MNPKENVEYLKLCAERDEITAETKRKDRKSIIEAVECCRFVLSASVVNENQTPGTESTYRPVLTAEDEHNVRDKMMKLIAKL